ncbi:hypothetical protein IPA_05515 [Ignicoccus pacificus DSM 13166]|uniref:Probable membrane transporter protein n=1 Tax=Ignicoccus pacificus DSM 13166 TaxID=940294 RepID=A0A977KBC1_9CREN|nr:hypothetical protein IPA_05515 [Ignicoccus pacificus DSM 13166]
MLTWLAIGFVAGLLDYTLALGYGLTASLILVPILGMDPKQAVSVIVFSQLLTLIPAFIAHLREGNVSLSIPWPVLVFIAMTSVLSFILPFFILSMSIIERRVLYSLTLLAALAVLEIRKRVWIRSRYVLSFFALIAALDKSTVGGGLSIIFVTIQTIFNVDLKNAIAMTPLLKLIPTLTTALGYLSAMKGIDFGAVLLMSAGSLLSLTIAPKLLKRVKSDERMIEGLLLLASILNLLRIFL